MPRLVVCEQCGTTYNSETVKTCPAHDSKGKKIRTKMVRVSFKRGNPKLKGRNNYRKRKKKNKKK